MIPKTYQYNTNNLRNLILVSEMVMNKWVRELLLGEPESTSCCDKHYNYH